MGAEWWAYVQGIVLGGFVAGTICYYMGRYYEAKRVYFTIDLEAIDDHVVLRAFQKDQR